MQRTTKAMCHVAIGYQDFILSAADGMKLVAILQNAVEADRDFGEVADIYRVKEQPRVVFRLIKAEQIVMPEGVARTARARSSSRKLIGRSLDESEGV